MKEFKCKNCNNNHDGKYGSGRFCSKKCAKGFSTKEKRKEINEKVSIKQKGKYNGCGFKKGFDSRRFVHTSESVKKATQTRIENINKKLWEEIGVSTKKSRVFKEQNGKCNKCRLDKWNNISLVLEWHHKDGNTENETRENVEFLCPNCHSQTDTWRRHKKPK